MRINKTDYADIQYPVWWETTITLFNKYTDPLTYVVKWYKTILPLCFWKSSNNRVTIGNTELQTNDVICRVRKSNKYKSKAEWVELPNDEMGEYFTFSEGDIIIIGDIPDEINEREKGKKSTEIIAKYKGLQACIVVKSFSDNTGAGRVYPHYFIDGE